MSDLHDFRSSKDAFFRDGYESPLTFEQRRAFAGLTYFPANPALRFLVEPEALAQNESFALDLSTGDTVTYQRWARVQFDCDGQRVALTVFRNPESGDLFLPFKDATSGTGETYAAGRYVDVEELPDGRLVLDFNYAYNPYCAYSEQWSCPLTPAENVLVIRISAGEKAFPNTH